MSKRIDLKGQQFGRWTVLEFDTEKTKQAGQTYWICQCNCNKKTIKSVRATHLKSGQSTSCGCYRNEQTRKANMKDLTGQVFGLLTVLEPTEKRRCTSVVWKCYCNNCNSICYKASNDLQKGTISCGCINSRGEVKIKNILKENNISFKEQYTFDDLRGEDFKKLRFDFAIFSNDELSYLIEYQGSQHYYPSSLFGGEESLKRQKELDQIKRDYCESHNIKLIIIPYKDYNKLSIEYLNQKVKDE